MTTTTSPVLIILTDPDRAELKALARARKAPLRSVQRACIILAAADGHTNAQIARYLGLHVGTVRTWRGRFAADGMKGLADRLRSGRPPVFAATVRAEIKALACALPAEHGMPLVSHAPPVPAISPVEARCRQPISGETRDSADVPPCGGMLGLLAGSAQDPFQGEGRARGHDGPPGHE